MSIDRAPFYFSAKFRGAQDARSRAVKARDKKQAARDGINDFLGNKIGTAKQNGQTNGQENADDCDYGDPQGARKAAGVFKGTGQSSQTRPSGDQASSRRGANVVSPPKPRAGDKGPLRNKFR